MMVKIDSVKLISALTGLMQMSKTVERQAYGMLYKADCTDTEFVAAAQALQKIRHNDMVQEDMEARASKIMAEIRASRPSKPSVWVSCTMGVFHTWETLLDNYKIDNGTIKVKRCECGAYHEERWNDKERYLLRNWQAKKDED